MNDHSYSEAERLAIYRAIYERRDMRHFNDAPVAGEVVDRILKAACAAGGCLLIVDSIAQLNDTEKIESAAAEQLQHQQQTRSKASTATSSSSA